jgi:hypothetical protein
MYGIASQDRDNKLALRQISSKGSYTHKQTKTQHNLRDNIKDILKKREYNVALATHLALGRKLKLKPSTLQQVLILISILHPEQDNRQ